MKMKISTHILLNCFQKSNIMLCLNMLLCRNFISKISLDVLPFVIIPFLMFLASFSLYSTIGVFVGTILLLYYIRKRLSLVRPRSTFFIVWMISSVIWLTLVFNIFVIMLLEILPEENFILVAMTFGSVGFLYQAKMKAQKSLLPFNKSSYINGDVESKEEDAVNLISIHNDQPYFCRHCQANVPNNKNHCIWLDCCIGPENETMFFCGNFLGMLALLYGSNLTLTTICHPFIFYYPYIKFLLPDDCSDVYTSSTNAVSFVSAIYCMIIATKMFWYLLKTIIYKMGSAGMCWGQSSLRTAHSGLQLFTFKIT